MRIGFGRVLLFVAALGMVSASATAQEKKKDNKDPNRIICERQEELGSRLQAKRICMTAAEWATKRREDRQMIDRAQTQGVPPSGN